MPSWSGSGSSTAGRRSKGSVSSSRIFPLCTLVVSLNFGHCSYECTVLGSSEKRHREKGRNDYGWGQQLDFTLTLYFTHSVSFWHVGSLVCTDCIIHLQYTAYILPWTTSELLFVCIGITTRALVSSEMLQRLLQGICIKLKPHSFLFFATCWQQKKLQTQHWHIVIL